MENIIGVWRSDLTDEFTKSEYGNVTMEFTQDGTLIYFIHGLNEKGIYMTFRIEGELLITNQPSLPKEERTQFRIIDNHLELYFGGIRSKFIKV